MSYLIMQFKNTNQDEENLISLIRLNPVTDVAESVKRGLIATRTRLDEKLNKDDFKELLTTDPTTMEGETQVAEYFNVQLEWENLTEKWEKENRTVIGFRRYYELLFLVKSKSKYDQIWFSFFEGMHRHAAVIIGTLCAKFNHSTNELEPGSLTLEHFKNKDIVKSFGDPGLSVEEQLNNIMTKQTEAPMFNNTFCFHGYIPKITNLTDAGNIIEGAKLQSAWISRFKVHSARVTISKNIAVWLKLIQAHSTGATRNNSKYRPNIARRDASKIVHQVDTKVSTYRKAIDQNGRGDDCHVYNVPSVITSDAWKVYIKSPFEGVARKIFVQTMTFPCIDESKTSSMSPPFRITYESVTSDIGEVTTKSCARPVDVRLYNAYLIIPGIVMHLASKAKNTEVNSLLGEDFEVNVINFVARYGNYTRKSPFVTIHGAYTKYIEVMTDVQFICELTGKSQIVPVTMFLVMLYNACFMYQNNMETNLLTTALDVLDLGAAVDYEKFMHTMSEFFFYEKFRFGKSRSENSHNISILVFCYVRRCTVVVYIRCSVCNSKLQYCEKN